MNTLFECMSSMKSSMNNFFTLELNSILFDYAIT